MSVIYSDREEYTLSYMSDVNTEYMIYTGLWVGSNSASYSLNESSWTGITPDTQRVVYAHTWKTFSKFKTMMAVLKLCKSRNLLKRISSNYRAYCPLVFES